MRSSVSRATKRQRQVPTSISASDRNFFSVLENPLHSRKRATDLRRIAFWSGFKIEALSAEPLAVLCFMLSLESRTWRGFNARTAGFLVYEPLIRVSGISLPRLFCWGSMEEDEAQRGKVTYINLFITGFRNWEIRVCVLKLLEDLNLTRVLYWDFLFIYLFIF